MTDNREYISVLGLGKSGIAVSKLARRNGAEVYVSDFGKNEQLEKIAKELVADGIDVELGGHDFDKIRKSSTIVISPGIDSRKIPQIDEYGVPVVSEVEYANRYIKGRIIGITGSNGKSTTTALIGEIFKNAGFTTYVVGNIGDPVSDIADKTNEDDIIVIELSSFQLERVETFKPAVSIVLNLTPDHLNRYDSLNDYYEAKMNIFNNLGKADYVILNSDDKLLLDKTAKLGSKKLYFGLETKLNSGMHLENGMIMFDITGSNSTALIKAADLVIPGPHNIANAMASSLAALAIGVPVSSITDTLKTFSGLYHRLEFVRELDGVRYINDSKSTNLDSLKVALMSFDKPLILLAGGYDKGSDFSELVNMLPEKMKCAILFGQTANSINNVLSGKIDSIITDTMFDALEIAKNKSETGDIILLSPGCASYDQFKNFEDRGDQFKKMVMEL